MFSSLLSVQVNTKTDSFNIHRLDDDLTLKQDCRVILTRFLLSLHCHAVPTSSFQVHRDVPLPGLPFS